MKLTINRFWCEWDIGINDEVWLEREDMLEDVRAALRDSDIEEDLEELEEAGLIGFEWKRVR